MYPIYFLMTAVIASLVQIFIFSTPVITTILISVLACTIGLQGLYAFLGHYFKSDEVAKGIGWPTGNPFQKEIAFTNLGMGIIGILSIWRSGEFWLATIIVHAVFVWGAASVHYKEMKEKNNDSPFNSGPVFYFDLLLPVLHFGLYAAWAMAGTE